ncbi:hypothetical protein GU920_18555 [Rhodobacter sp. CCP-1]|uniref:Hedgehog/Intein (Hint) domain-containing protein n=2 Tax=Paragemmobacter ruber TaxID=1985673 RepID=A0ABW9YAI0_9RHOB|nr:hypothetical protein [Rhodobacter ruber]
MGILIPQSSLSAPLASAMPVSAAPAVEATMLSQGLRLRVGPLPGDLCAVEDISIGDPIWDLATSRLIDVDGMACATLVPHLLDDMGLRAMPVETAVGHGYLALASARIVTPVQRPQPAFGPTVFFRFWPESRLVAEVEGRPVLLRGTHA